MTLSLLQSALNKCVYAQFKKLPIAKDVENTIVQLLARVERSDDDPLNHCGETRFLNPHVSEMFDEDNPESDAFNDARRHNNDKFTWFMLYKLRMLSDAELAEYKRIDMICFRHYGMMDHGLSDLTILWMMYNNDERPLTTDEQVASSFYCCLSDVKNCMLRIGDGLMDNPFIVFVMVEFMCACTLGIVYDLERVPLIRLQQTPKRPIRHQIQRPIWSHPPSYQKPNPSPPVIPNNNHVTIHYTNGKKLSQSERKKLAAVAI